MKNIDIDIDMVILENIDIDIDKGILQNIDIDKMSYQLEFGISNRARYRGSIKVKHITFGNGGVLKKIRNGPTLLLLKLMIASIGKSRNRNNTKVNNFTNKLKMYFSLNNFKIILLLKETKEQN